MLLHSINIPSRALSEFYNYTEAGEKLDAVEGVAELEEDYLEEMDGDEVEEDEVV